MTGRAAQAIDMIEGANLPTTAGWRWCTVRSVGIADRRRQVAVPRDPDLNTAYSGRRPTCTLRGGLVGQAGLAVAVSTVVRLQRVKQLGHDRWILCG